MVDLGFEFAPAEFSRLRSFHSYSVAFKNRLQGFQLGFGIGFCPCLNSYSVGVALPEPSGEQELALPAAPSGSGRVDGDIPGDCRGPG